MKMGNVAPCVGAWIETALYDGNGPRIEVAPCVGAWIETLQMETALFGVLCRTLRGCAG